MKNATNKILKGLFYVERTSSVDDDFQGRILCKSSEKNGVLNSEEPQIYIIAGEPHGQNGAANIHIEAHADLIAEAFNVVNETGLTPRQLAEQNKELLEACKKAISLLDLWGAWQYGTISENHEGEMQALSKMEEQLKIAIKNAEQVD